MVNSLKMNEEVLKGSSCPVESLKDPWNLLSLEVLCVLRSKSLQSCPTLWTPWTAARQLPLSMEFSRQEYWSGLPHPPPGNLLDPGIKPSLGEILLEEIINALINCITIFGCPNLWNGTWALLLSMPLRFYFAHGKSWQQTLPIPAFVFQNLS